MRIQHNIAALNSYRQLGSNNNTVSKNLEKLSSGYRINRAGDDAAGLAISEKMRAQITGLETASKNANDGISLVQTAEGALTEVHSMLNRMVELADQSANGTQQDAVDRENIQKEVNSLKSEIDRISEGTNFNGINLLDGSLATKEGATKVSTITDNGVPTDLVANNGQTFKQSITFSAGANSTEQTINLKYLDKEGKVKEAEFKFTTAAAADAGDNATKAATEITKLFGDNYNVTTTAGGVLTIESKENGADQTQIITARQTDGVAAPADMTISTLQEGKDDTFTVAGATVAADVTKNNFLNIDGTKYQILTRGKTAESGAKALYIDQSGTDPVPANNALNKDSAAQIAAQLKEYGVNASSNGTNIIIAKADAKSVAKGGLTLQIGDTADSFNQMKVSISSMNTKNLGIAGIDISTQQGAKDAVSLIKDAINTVSSTRGDLGALQNRLEHTINNLGVTSENMTAAESRIRDVDMAKEMMNYTKNNILVQASQSMLAQANQTPQGVLQLLK
ncbi:flagellin [Lacrimispora sp. AGF001]|uniref:flagellin N-terminal helical domain-containing protein n=1 Tax=Lacrimispora sp. AGF001 TaxID=3401631 RepID=UPI003B42EF17